MKRPYLSFKPDTGVNGAPNRFVSDSGGAERGVPVEGSDTDGRQMEQGPFDPPRYWQFFPGTD